MFAAAGPAANAALVAAILVLGTQRGQFDQIAGYAAGLGAGVLVAVPLTGGSTLTYVNGSADEREAVLRFRIYLAGPALFVLSASAAVAYSWITQLPWHAVLLGGVSASVGTYSELGMADLQRSGRVARLLLLTVVSRVTALLIVFAGATYSLGMAVGAILLFLTLRLHVPTRLTTSALGLHQAFLQGYRARTFGYTMANAAVMRLPLLIAPLAAGSLFSGAFASIVSVQQSLAAIATAALYTNMAMRSGNRNNSLTIARLNRLERVLVPATVVGCFLPLAATPIAMSMLNLAGEPSAWLWWVLFSAALPCLVFNRAVQYRLLSNRMDGRALSVMSGILIATVVGAMAALVLEDLAWMAAVSLFIEALLAIATLCKLYAKRWRQNGMS